MVTIWTCSFCASSLHSAPCSDCLGLWRPPCWHSHTSTRLKWNQKRRHRAKNLNSWAFVSSESLKFAFSLWSEPRCSSPAYCNIFPCQYCSACSCTWAFLHCMDHRFGNFQPSFRDETLTFFYGCCSSTSAFSSCSCRKNTSRTMFSCVTSKPIGFTCSQSFKWLALRCCGL